MIAVENIKEFDKKLKKHIEIESYFGNIWGLVTSLNEEHGLVPNLLKYVAVFKTKIINVMKSHYGNKNELMIKFDINDFAKIKPFFDLIDLSVTISLNNDVDKDMGGGGYRSGKSGFVKTNDGNEKYLIIIDIFNVKSISDDAAVNYACRIFAHELTHAYEDYQRHFYKKKTMADSAKENNLNTINAEVLKDNAIANLLYLTNPSEINAMVGELPLSIFNSCVNNYSRESVFQALKKTRMYQNYQILQSWMSQLQDIKLIKHKELLLFEFNRLTKFGYKTYNQMLAFIYKRFKKYERQLLIQGPKIAYDIYNGRIDITDYYKR